MPRSMPGKCTTTTMFRSSTWICMILISKVRHQFLVDGDTSTEVVCYRRSGCCRTVSTGPVVRSLIYHVDAQTGLGVGNIKVDFTEPEVISMGQEFARGSRAIDAPVSSPSRVGSQSEKMSKGILYIRIWA